ncbi:MULTISPECIES: TetR/AcrR family transcriptional regulator [unclassified Streptomyces]|uniref:TetR/AcrR family transcriptional regulator n=1 Tax=unclassified Streptomyces TaxID=2593676 RepID=UPI00224D2039|nr:MULTISPECIES: TetR/AcrR family transcriptional regulator [unclassified Streptomyces]MCX4528043.1 TetR/AcrR family transcriptional regulator [Streptomyces sp. NBC_01551]MCX4541342.1 TetR/AcrR family transcriptional regulator [Streptomyces sp. NBC_01565]
MAQDSGAARRKTAAARGSYAVGDARRQKILDTAVEHFAQWGFHASSLARIARDCGITQGGLLHHFRGKEDLLLSVLAQSERRDVERLFGEPAESVAAYYASVVALAEDNTRRPGLVRMFHTLVGEAGNPGHPAHAYFTQRYERVLGHTVAVLEAGVARGELRPDTDCEGAGREVLAVMDGLQIQWVLAPEALDMPERLRGFLDRQLRGMSAPGRAA